MPCICCTQNAVMAKQWPLHGWQLLESFRPAGGPWFAGGCGDGIDIWKPVREARHCRKTRCSLLLQWKALTILRKPDGNSLCCESSSPAYQLLSLSVEDAKADVLKAHQSQHVNAYWTTFSHKRRSVPQNPRNISQWRSDLNRCLAWRRHRIIRQCLAKTRGTNYSKFHSFSENTLI